MPSALALAAPRGRRRRSWSWAWGPGVVGTGTPLGTTAVEVAAVLDAAARPRRPGRRCACRASSADARPRHQGVSHHSRTVLGLAAVPARRCPCPRRWPARCAGRDACCRGARRRRASSTGRPAASRPWAGARTRTRRSSPPAVAGGGVGGRRPCARPRRPASSLRSVSAAKLERLLNLTALLLETPPAAVGAGDPRAGAGLPARSTTSFRRAFERDKDDLREMGVPLRGGRGPRRRPAGRGLPHPQGPLLPARPRPRPRRAGGAAPGGVGRPARRPRRPGRACSSSAAGGRGRRRPPAWRSASLPAGNVVARCSGRSRRGARCGSPTGARPRTVDPYRLDFRRGRWYLTGFDHGRTAERLFRLDRIESGVERLDGPRVRPAAHRRRSRAPGSSRGSSARASRCRPACWSTPPRRRGPSTTSAAARSTRSGPTGRWS